MEPFVALLRCIDRFFEAQSQPFHCVLHSGPSAALQALRINCAHLNTARRQINPYLGQLPAPVAANRQRRLAFRPPIPPVSVARCAWRNPKLRPNVTATPATFQRRNNAIPQISRIGSHPYWPPIPASSVNQKFTPEEIPRDSIWSISSVANCASGFNASL